jgi:hypothetical protein
LRRFMEAAVKNDGGELPLESLVINSMGMKV